MGTQGKENEDAEQQGIQGTITIIIVIGIKQQVKKRVEFGPGSRAYFHGYSGGTKKSH